MADNSLSADLYLETDYGYSEVNTFESPLPTAQAVIGHYLKLSHDNKGLQKTYFENDARIAEL